MANADFIERRWLRDWVEPNDATRDAAEALQQRGATHARFHVKEFTRELIAEGWRIRPEDEGDLPA